MNPRCTLSLLIIALLVPGMRAFADTIEMKDGPPKLKITVVEETTEKVVYRKGSLPPQSVPSASVADVKYHSGANEFKIAQEAFNNSDWLTAANLLKEFAEGLDADKEALRAHCMFQVATAYQKAGDWKEANAAFTRFANAYKDHRLYPDALLARAICFLNEGDYRKASDAIDSLDNAVSTKNLNDSWKQEVRYWKIYLQEKDNAQRALKDYEDLYNDVVKSNPDIANKARLRIGMVMIKQKKYDEAYSFFSDIIESRLDSDREAAAGAYLGRGKCILNKRNATKEDYKNALYDLVRVVVHYTDVGAYQAEGMYLAGKCFQLVGGKDSTKRWQTLFRRLEYEWPGTPWAQEAAKELGH